MVPSEKSPSRLEEKSGNPAFLEGRDVAQLERVGAGHSLRSLFPWTLLILVTSPRVWILVNKTADYWCLPEETKLGV